MIPEQVQQDEKPFEDEIPEIYQDIMGDIKDI